MADDDSNQRASDPASQDVMDSQLVQGIKAPALSQAPSLRDSTKNAPFNPKDDGMTSFSPALARTRAVDSQASCDTPPLSMSSPTAEVSNSIHSRRQGGGHASDTDKYNDLAASRTDDTTAENAVDQQGGHAITAFAKPDIIVESGLRRRHPLKRSHSADHAEREDRLRQQSQSLEQTQDDASGWSRSPTRSSRHRPRPLSLRPSEFTTPVSEKSPVLSPTVWSTPATPLRQAATAVADQSLHRFKTAASKLLFPFLDVVVVPGMSTGTLITPGRSHHIATGGSPQRASPLLARDTTLDGASSAMAALQDSSQPAPNDSPGSPSSENKPKQAPTVAGSGSASGPQAASGHSEHHWSRHEQEDTKANNDSGVRHAMKAWLNLPSTANTSTATLSSAAGDEFTNVPDEDICFVFSRDGTSVETISLADVCAVSVSVFMEPQRICPQGEIVIVSKAKSLSRNEWLDWVKLLLFSLSLFLFLSSLLGPLTALCLASVLGVNRLHVGDFLLNLIGITYEEFSKSRPGLLAATTLWNVLFYVAWPLGYTPFFTALALGGPTLYFSWDSLEHFFQLEEAYRLITPTYPIVISFVGTAHLKDLLDAREQLFGIDQCRKVVSHLAVGSYWVEATLSVLLYHDIYNSRRARQIAHVFFTFILPIVYSIQIIFKIFPNLYMNHLRIMASVRADFGVRFFGHLWRAFVNRVLSITLPSMPKLVQDIMEGAVSFAHFLMWVFHQLTWWLLPIEEGFIYIRAKMHGLQQSIAALAQPFRHLLATELISTFSVHVLGLITATVHQLVEALSGLLGIFREPIQKTIKLAGMLVTYVVAPVQKLARYSGIKSVLDIQQWRLWMRRHMGWHVPEDDQDNPPKVAPSGILSPSSVPRRRRKRRVGRLNDSSDGSSASVERSESMSSSPAASRLTSGEASPSLGGEDVGDGFMNMLEEELHKDDLRLLNGVAVAHVVSLTARKARQTAGLRHVQSRLRAQQLARRLEAAAAVLHSQEEQRDDDIEEDEEDSAEEQSQHASLATPVGQGEDGKDITSTLQCEPSAVAEQDRHARPANVQAESASISSDSEDQEEGPPAAPLPAQPCVDDSDDHWQPSEARPAAELAESSDQSTAKIACDNGEAHSTAHSVHS